MITDLASEAALKAHVDNFATFWMGYGNGPDSEVVNTPELCTFATGLPHPLFNGVLRTNLTPETVDTTIPSVVARFKTHRVPAFWWVGPTTQPATLPDAITRNQFARVGNTPGMAADLQTADLDRPLPPGVNIIRVGEPETLKDYLFTLARGSDIPEPMHSPLLNKERGFTVPSGAEIRRYLGMLDGKPVATCAMILSAGVAGIYAVATLPEARRKGIGAAITAYPLREAYALGYRVSTLQASSMGFPVYEKIGFQTVCDFALYLWTDRSRPA